MAGNFFCMKTTMNPQTLPEYIKPGAVVKLRDGSKGEIYSINNALPYPIHGRTLSNMRAATWTNNLYIWASAEESQQDIIGPWIDKPDCSALWPLLPPWIKYLAMDKNYGWFGYKNKPLQGISSWHSNGTEDDYCTIPSKYVPIYSGDWKDSLVERP